MPDWKDYVRERLNLEGLPPERAEGIVQDSASRLERTYREALSRGAIHEDAARMACNRIGDWQGLPDGLEHSDQGSVHAGSERGPAEAGSPGRNPVGRKGRFPTFLSDFPGDLLYGLRILKKNPGFTTIALMTLALGIGVNTALFSLFEAWQRLPNRLQEPDILAFLWYRQDRAPGRQVTHHYRDYAAPG
jgi:hypothetical protein